MYKYDMEHSGKTYVFAGTVTVGRIIQFMMLIRPRLQHPYSFAMKQLISALQHPLDVQEFYDVQRTRKAGSR